MRHDPRMHLRPLEPADVPAAADCWVRARRGAAAIPPPVHPDDDARAHFAELLVPTREVWLAGDDDGAVVGVLVLGDTELEQLYVVPERTGQGVGAALLRRAQELRPGGLSLWTFSSNDGARRFYARHGFVDVDRTDGSGNEERAPDVRLAWPGSRDPQPHDAVAANLDPQADNRIHDDDVARQYGFAGALVPGVELFALATAPYVRAWGEAFLAAGRLHLRFRKPVYDGERVTVSGVADLALTGPDGTVRSTGSVAPPAPQPAVPVREPVPLPDRLAPEPVPGAFGTVVQVAEAAACAEYVRAVGEAWPGYDELVHPGLVLRLVNLALMSNVDLGAWVHTASDCRFLGLARVGDELQVRSEVTEVSERRGHRVVRYDAVVLSPRGPVARVDHEAIWRLRPPT